MCRRERFSLGPPYLSHDAASPALTGEGLRTRAGDSSAAMDERTRVRMYVCVSTRVYG